MCETIVPSVMPRISAMAFMGIFCLRNFFVSSYVVPSNVCFGFFTADDELGGETALQGGLTAKLRRRQITTTKIFAIGNFRKFGGDSALGGVSAKFLKITEGCLTNGRRNLGSHRTTKRNDPKFLRTNDTPTN